MIDPTITQTHKKVSERRQKLNKRPTCKKIHKNSGSFKRLSQSFLNYFQLTKGITLEFRQLHTNNILLQ